MFDDEFTQYLDGIFSDQYCHLVMCARQAFMNLGFSLVESNLYRLLPSSTQLTNMDFKLQLTNMLVDGFTEVFRALGIKIFTRDILQLTNLLTAISQLEESSDHDSILTIINNDSLEDSDSIFEELLKLFIIDGSVPDIMLNIGFYDNCIIIDELYRRHLEEDINTSGEATDERLDPNYVDRVNKFLANYPNSKVAELYNAKALLPGNEFKHYVLESSNWLKLFYPTHPQAVPVEFLGLALFGGVQRHELSNVIKSTITRFYTDLSFTTKTNMLVDNLIQEVEINGISKSSPLV